MNTATRGTVILIAGLMAALLAACGAPRAPDAAALNASYEAALLRTAAEAVELPGGEAGARAVLAGMEQLFADPSPAAVRERAARLYSPGAYLNDTLVALEGSDAIAAYFAHTAGNVQGFGLEILDVTARGSDYFARWRMTVTAESLHGGRPMVSYGMTHFRFDAGGAILLHKDFWDAGTGLYEYIPGFGGLVRRVRSAALPE